MLAQPVTSLVAIVIFRVSVLRKSSCVVPANVHLYAVLCHSTLHKCHCRASMCPWQHCLNLRGLRQDERSHVSAADIILRRMARPALEWLAIVRQNAHVTFWCLSFSAHTAPEVLVLCLESKNDAFSDPRFGAYDRRGGSGKGSGRVGRGGCRVARRGLNKCWCCFEGTSKYREIRMRRAGRTSQAGNQIIQVRRSNSDVASRGVEGLPRRKL